MKNSNDFQKLGSTYEDPTGPKSQFMNSTTGLGATGSASLKGKLLSLEELVRSITEEMNYHKKEVQILRSEKDTLEGVLNMKITDVRKSLMNEIARVEDEMKRHFAHQKAENSRLQQQITQLKGEKTSLQQQLLGLQRRIAELENQIGNEDA